MPHCAASVIIVATGLAHKTPCGQATAHTVRSSSMVWWKVSSRRQRGHADTPAVESRNASEVLLLKRQAAKISCQDAPSPSSSHVSDMRHGLPGAQKRGRSELPNSQAIPTLRPSITIFTSLHPLGSESPHPKRVASLRPTLAELGRRPNPRPIALFCGTCEHRSIG